MERREGDRRKRTDSRHEARYVDNKGLNQVVWCRNEHQVALIELLDRLATDVEQLITHIYREGRVR